MSETTKIRGGQPLSSVYLYPLPEVCFATACKAEMYSVFSEGEDESSALNLGGCLSDLSVCSSGAVTHILLGTGAFLSCCSQACHRWSCILPGLQGSAPWRSGCWQLRWCCVLRSVCAVPYPGLTPVLQRRGWHSLLCVFRIAHSLKGARSLCGETAELLVVASAF